ncbi:DUF5693 family protein [Paenibacillus sp. UMB4589-SE434]|uniref:DUF5693 family protein n=1 Tax=Paenibacillus sp. UMB4589-SE434 TaxID=3046314 RepID=UPI0025502E8C|nr:DUF5693 family protein [Paenibacillus sp. UMB4589-SE434]MDK8181609.1 DUF5693 family protein [Paenibacillus sp. UMB4589-SE434]
MLQSLEQMNRRFKKWLWLLVIVGLVASLPVVVQRVQTEQTSKNVEFVFDYRDLVDISVYKPNPAAYINEQLDRLKEAGVQSMAMFESSLQEMKSARRIVLYNSNDAALLHNKVANPNENYTYLLFQSQEDERELSPLIEKTFIQLGINVRLWKFDGKNGLVIETPIESALMKSMPQDPIAMKQLRDKGFNIVPRLSDSSLYNQKQTEELLKMYDAIGVTRILFDGESVKGFNDDVEMNSLTAFADLLNKHGIGIAAIEGLKAPQKGFNKLAYLTKYNVARIHSIAEAESFNDPKVLGDRLALASKDRNIRMFYLNATVKRDVTKSEIVDSVENLIHSMQEPGQGLAKIKHDGFEFGQAKPFQIEDAGWQRYAKAVAVVGGVALIALLISYFVPYVMLLVFIVGLVGAAGLFAMHSSLLEQVLALGVAVSAPSIAMVLAIRRIEMSAIDSSLGSRLSRSVMLFVRTVLLSLIAVPYVIAFLNNITYSLVLTQFRGVSLLHLAPLALTALYVFLYRGESVFKEAKRWLMMPFTLLWVVGFGVAAIGGYYYLSRTGNAGNVSSLEQMFRYLLENTFGVRPRNKEFLFAHPLLLVGAFIAFRYRIGQFLLIAAAMGQLSMVDTFAHIHTPVIISAIRTGLGLGLGLIIGVIGILVWYVIERCWDAWRPKLKQ